MIKNRMLSAFFILFVLMTAVFPPDAYAKEEPQKVRVGYYENEVFQEGAKEGAVKSGYAYEYYLKLSEYTGWDYEYVYGSFGDIYAMVLNGEIDLIAGLAYKDERVELISYPELPMGSESYSFVKHDSDADITTDPRSFGGKKIGVLDSAMVDVLGKYLDAHDIDAEVLTFADYEELFREFDAKDIDILAAEGDGAHDRAHAEVLFAFGGSDYYLCVNKARPDLLAELNTAQSMLASEEPNYLNSLNMKYYPASVSSRAFSVSEKEWADTHSELHIGYLENYLPYSDTNGSGEVTGMVKDLIPEIFEELGLDGITVIYTGYKSYDEMISAMQSDTIDAAFPVGGGLYYSEENGLYQSSPVISAPTELVFSGEYDDSTVSRFAVNKNNKMQYYYVSTNFPDAEIMLCDSIEECLDAVIDGKAEATTLNGMRAVDLLKNSGYRSLSHRHISKNDDRCFGVKIGNEGLLKLLNRGIAVTGSEYAQNIAYRYTGELYSYGFTDVLKDHAAEFSVIAAAVLVTVIFLLARDIKRTRMEIADKERSRSELEQTNMELEENRKALAKALGDAEHANRAKTVFLNNMSHDIRTPMNAIIGFTTLASSHIDDRDQVRSYLDKINVSSRHLLSLINDVLDMSRIESGKYTINVTAVHLPDVIRDIQTIMQANMLSKHLAFIVDTDDMIHDDVITDKLRLEQILLNILSNAVKFTPDDGTISLHVAEKPSSAEETVICFCIRDTGIGMSDEFRKTIFEPFTREQTSTVSGIQGTGLGMAITKKIVDMMGGTITVESREGEGSEFNVSIPCRTAPDSVRSDDTPGDSTDGFEGKTVLLAEDNDMNRMIATAILRDMGLTVEIAENGREAVDMVEKADAGHYAIVLMDIQMPVMNGYDAAVGIRALSDVMKASIPIVAVTANAFEEDRQLAFASGMNGHLAKPYDIAQIKATLREMI